MYVDDMYVEMRPTSSASSEGDSTTYMEMRSDFSSFARDFHSPRLPSSPGPTMPRGDSASPVQGVPAPSTVPPIYEYADISVTARRRQHQVKKPTAQSLDSLSTGNSLYYASKDLLVTKKSSNGREK